MCFLPFYLLFFGTSEYAIIIAQNELSADRQHYSVRFGGRQNNRAFLEEKKKKAHTYCYTTREMGDIYMQYVPTCRRGFLRIMLTRRLLMFTKQSEEEVMKWFTVGRGWQARYNSHMTRALRVGLAHRVQSSLKCSSIHAMRTCTCIRAHCRQLEMRAASLPLLYNKTVLSILSLSTGSNAHLFHTAKTLETSTTILLLIDPPIQPKWMQQPPLNIRRCRYTSYIVHIILGLSFMLQHPRSCQQSKTKKSGKLVLTYFSLPD